MDIRRRKGASVLDYVMANEKSEEKILEIKIGDRTESDHFPLEEFKAQR